MKPQFIVIEGLEGAGKSTAVNVVKQLLEKAGVKQVITTREPGGTPIAEEIRALIKTKYPSERLSPHTELLLMVAGRVQLVENIIKPALAQGHWVVSDRHVLSTWAYQGGGRQLPDDMIRLLHLMLFAEFKPDFTIYLDIDPLVGLQRIGKRGEALDRIEQEDMAFFTRTHEKYLDLVQSDPNVACVNAEQSLVDVAADINRVLLEKYSSLAR